MKLKSHSLALCSQGIALLVVCSWISIPFGPVPFTLQTFALVFILVLFKPKEAIFCVLVYLLAGFIGLPVFAGFRGGIATCLGPTGGFLWGFAIAIVITSFIAAMSEKLQVKLLSAALFMLISYICGLVQFAFVTGTTFVEAFFVSIVPFVIFDALKLFVGCIAALKVKSSLSRLRR